MSGINEVLAKQQIDHVADDLKRQALICRNLAQYTEPSDPDAARALRACAPIIEEAAEAARLAGYRSLERVIAS